MLEGLAENGSADTAGEYQNKYFILEVFFVCVWWFPYMWLVVLRVCLVFSSKRCAMSSEAFSVLLHVC